MKQKVFMMPTSLYLSVATTSSFTSDDKVGTMTTFASWWIYIGYNHVGLLCIVIYRFIMTKGYIENRLSGLVYWA